MQEHPEISIIYEDEYLLALNKPAHLVVNRAESVKTKTIQDWIEISFPELFKLNQTHESFDIFRERSGMVHRLDKDTSGVLLWSKDPETLTLLMSQFKERLVHKTYMALVHGWFTTHTGTIRVPMGRLSRNRKQFGVVVGGKMTETEYQVEQEFKANPQYPGGFSLVKLFPKTGRTHQLRVVLKHLNHPIVGDSHYVGKKRSKHDAKWCQRQFLHAYAIEFNHPRTNQNLNLTAELSPDLKIVLDGLEVK